MLTSWQYILPMEKRQEFGFKQLIYEDDVNSFFLIDGRPDECGKEIFRQSGYLITK
jgi:hypothetical protein